MAFLGSMWTALGTAGQGALINGIMGSGSAGIQGGNAIGQQSPTTGGGVIPTGAPSKDAMGTVGKQNLPSQTPSSGQQFPDFSTLFQDEINRKKQMGPFM